MEIQLRYFTGTGNSLKVLNTMKNIFTDATHDVEISTIVKGESITQCEIAGFCFPVYAFGIPRISKQYLKSLPKFRNKQKAFIIITAGDSDEAGFSVEEAVSLLRKKNCDIIYSAVIQMPINWITAMNPPDEKKALEIIDLGVSQTRIAATNILDGIRSYHKFNIPKRYGRFGLYREYLLFKLGLMNLWRTFRVEETCNGCRKCAKACPTNSIEFKNDMPVWSSTCEQCMRCVNLCPTGSIYQKVYGPTSGRNRYLEPDFRPLHD